MKKLFLILFFLPQLSVNAQRSAWSLGFEFSVDNLSLSNGKNRNDYVITDGNINGYGIEWDQTNYSIGLITDYYFQTKFSLSTGILYSNKDFTGTYNCATCDFFPYPIIHETMEQRFLTVPISINYSFLTGKLKPVLQGGIKNNIEVKNDLERISKGYFLEAFVGAAVYYDFMMHWNAGIGYKYQAALTDLYETDDFDLRSNNFFLQIHYNLE